MRQLVPIKVKIGLNTEGSHKYPNFSLMSFDLKGMNWSKYVDVEGLGWLYDNVSGHGDVAPDSPIGIQFGVLVIPKLFADAAVKAFPFEVTKMTETEFIDFYDNRANVNRPEEKIDRKALEIFEVKKNLGIVLTPEEETRKEKVLNPLDKTPGIVKNEKRRWADYKKVVGVNIIQ